MAVNYNRAFQTGINPNVGQPSSMFRAPEYTVGNDEPSFRAQPDVNQGRNPDAPANVQMFMEALGLPYDDPYENRFDGVTARNLNEPNPEDPMSYLPELQPEDQRLLDGVNEMLSTQAAPEPAVMEMDMMNISGDFTPPATQSPQVATQPTSPQNIYEPEQSDFPELEFSKDMLAEAMFLDALGQSEAASRGAAAPQSLARTGAFTGQDPASIERMRAANEQREAQIGQMGVGNLMKGAQFIQKSNEYDRNRRMASMINQLKALDMLRDTKSKMQPDGSSDLKRLKIAASLKDSLSDEQIQAILDGLVTAGR